LSANGQPYRSIEPDRLREWLGDYCQTRALDGWPGLPRSLENSMIDLYLANETPLGAALGLLLALRTVGLEGIALDRLLDLCERRDDLRRYAQLLLDAREVAK
jgi:hypothetical protein